MRESVSGKIELLNQIIDELQVEVDEAGYEEVKLINQLENLESAIDERNEELSRAHGALNARMEGRGAAVSEIEIRRTSLVAIEELTRRFSLPDLH